MLRHTFRRVTVFVTVLVTLFSTIGYAHQEPTQMQANNPTDLLRAGANQTKAFKVRDNIFVAYGFGNTMMVTTRDGNVIIDTSLVTQAPRHVRLLKAESPAPVKYIILTHAHGDHAGGVGLWKETGTQLIAQKNHTEFVNYQVRLSGFYAARNAAQFALAVPRPQSWAGNYGAKIEATTLFDDRFDFTLGGVKFEVYATPGETPDHLTVWIPEYKVAFTGDNYYDSFPNIYTLRGTRERPALDYVNSLNKVLSLKPEIVIPSHGVPIIGSTEVVKRLTRYRDAIQYVHDETIKGMNAGKSVWALMQEVKLPKDLDIGESYGKLSWSVRGIYEGYVGWFDLNPVTMYELPVTVVYSDVVKLAGGADAVAKLAMERAQSGRSIEALHLSDIALAADGKNKGALEARLKALEVLRNQCKNTNERGWLDHGIKLTKDKLGVK